MAQASVQTSLVVSVDDPAVFHAVKQLAAQRQTRVSEIVTTALREWLEREEALEDLAAIADAAGDQVLPWEQVKAEMKSARAERRDG